MRSVNSGYSKKPIKKAEVPTDKPTNTNKMTYNDNNTSFNINNQDTYKGRELNESQSSKISYNQKPNKQEEPKSSN